MSANNSCSDKECMKYNTCVKNLVKQMQVPTDTTALYADRLYDTQTAGRRCYEQGPVTNFVEGFGFGGNMNMGTILKWVLIAAVIYLLYSLFRESQSEVVRINVPTVTEGTFTAKQ